MEMELIKNYCTVNSYVNYNMSFCMLIVLHGEYQMMNDIVGVQIGLNLCASYE